MFRLLTVSMLALAMAGGGAAEAATVHAAMAMATPAGPGAAVGGVTIKDSPKGAVFIVDLYGLPPGPHGFHVHANGSCDPGPDKTGKIIPAGAAAGHFDPAMTAKHEGPDGMGHMGDLPLITVDAAGVAKMKVTAAHITDVKTLAGHALMLHANGDNYSDVPAPLGGGGGRLVCGVIN